MSLPNKPSSDNLNFTPSDASWAVQDFIHRPPSLFARIFFIFFGLAFLTLLFVLSQTNIDNIIELKGSLLTTAVPVELKALQDHLVGATYLNGNEWVPLNTPLYSMVNATKGPAGEVTNFLAPYDGLLLGLKIRSGQFVSKGTSVGYIAKAAKLEQAWQIQAILEPGFKSENLQNQKVEVVFEADHEGLPVYARLQGVSAEPLESVRPNGATELVGVRRVATFVFVNPEKFHPNKLTYGQRVQLRLHAPVQNVLQNVFGKLVGAR